MWLSTMAFAGRAALLPGADFGAQAAAWGRNEGGGACPTSGTRLTGDIRTRDTIFGDPGLRRAVLSRAGGRMAGTGRPTAVRRGADAGVADRCRRRGVVVDCRGNAADLLRLWQHAARIPR